MKTLFNNTDEFWSEKEKKNILKESKLNIILKYIKKMI